MKCPKQKKIIFSSDSDHHGRGRLDGRQEHGDGRHEDDRAEAHRLPDLQQPSKGRQLGHGEPLQHPSATGRNDGFL